MEWNRMDKYPDPRTSSESTLPQDSRDKSEFEQGERINHPKHYGGENNPYEAIKVIEAWRAGFNIGNALKYICRSSLRPKLVTDLKNLEDLQKARWYLDREIRNIQDKL